MIAFFVAFLANQKHWTAKLHMVTKAPLIAKPAVAEKPLLPAQHYSVVKAPVVKVLCCGCEGAQFFGAVKPAGKCFGCEVLPQPRRPWQADVIIADLGVFRQQMA